LFYSIITVFIERLHCINNLTSQQINVDSILALNTFYLLKKNHTKYTRLSVYGSIWGFGTKEPGVE